MKKVGVVTMYGYGNMGSLLQCYATQTVLFRLGYESVMLHRRETSSRRIEMKIGRYVQFLFRCMRNPQRMANLLAVRKHGKMELARISAATMTAMRQFDYEYIKSQSVSFGELERLARSTDYVAFISGSDQIWSVTGPYRDPMNFLRFAPRDKRVAFAPSFGVSEIPAYDKGELAAYISEYHYVSVREQRGAEIIKDLTGREAAVLVDPTLQLDGTFWREVSAEHSEMGRSSAKYILLYFLSPPSPVALETVKHIRTYTCWDMLITPCNYEEFSGLGSYRVIDGGPFDLVSLIADAALVCTDSFHGTAFSIDLNVPFLSFDREHGHIFSQSSRLLSILDICGLSSRFLRESPAISEGLFKMDFTESNRRLEVEREKAIAYLSSSIEGVNVRLDGAGGHSC
jgi:hypothetical protein